MSIVWEPLLEPGVVQCLIQPRDKIGPLGLLSSRKHGTHAYRWAVKAITVKSMHEKVNAS